MEKIIKMALKDVKEILLLGKDEKEFYVTENDSFWNESDLKNWTKDKNHIGFVYDSNGEMGGFVLGRLDLPTKTALMDNIFVRDELRGKGIAKKLIEEFSKAAKKKGVQFLWCLISPNNPASGKLSESLSFTRGYRFDFFSKKI